MSALMQGVRHGLPLLAAGLGVLLFSRLYHLGSWTSAAASPLFNLAVRHLDPMLAGAWLLWLLWRSRQAARYLTRIRRSNAGHQHAPVTYRVLPRAGTAPGVVDAVPFWNQVHDLVPTGRHVTWEVTGDAHALSYTLTASDTATGQLVVGQIVADWPGATVQLADSDPLVEPDCDTVRQTEVRPQLWTQQITSSVADPLHAVLLYLTRLPGGVRGGVVVKVRRDAGMRRWMQFNLQRVRVRLRQTRTHALREREKALAERLSRPLFEVDVVAWIAAASGKATDAEVASRRLARLLDAQLDRHCQTPRRRGVPLRVFPTLLGKPWNDRELALIAHLSVIEATQLQTAPAQTFVPETESHHGR